MRRSGVGKKKGGGWRGHEAGGEAVQPPVAGHLRTCRWARDLSRRCTAHPSHAPAAHEGVLLLELGAAPASPLQLRPAARVRRLQLLRRVRMRVCRAVVPQELHLHELELRAARRVGLRAGERREEHRAHMLLGDLPQAAAAATSSSSGHKQQQRPQAAAYRHRRTTRPSASADGAYEGASGPFVCKRVCTCLDTACVSAKYGTSSASMALGRDAGSSASSMRSSACTAGSADAADAAMRALLCAERQQPFCSSRRGTSRKRACQTRTRSRLLLQPHLHLHLPPTCQRHTPTAKTSALAPLG